jgi:phosphatidylserine decarboxylase
LNEGTLVTRQIRRLQKLRGYQTLPLTLQPDNLPWKRMKYKGNARKAAFKLIFWSLVIVLVVCGLGAFTVTAAAAIAAIAVAISPFLIILWIVFAIFTLYFFRDPDARPPVGANLVLAPGHGKVDVVGHTKEPEFMGGDCQRVSIFLSVIDVHVQNAPVGGTVAFFKYSTGQFLNALKAASATHNENVLLGFETNEPRGLKVGVRLIAGVLARRIVPFVKAGEEVERGQRISLIQFGSRADVYLPENAKIMVKLGDHVVGGRTVLATFEPSAPV